MTCACGTPSEASWYVQITYGTGDTTTGTQTDYADGYYCEQHKATPTQLRPEHRQHWKILESTTQHLR